MMEYRDDCIRIAKICAGRGIFISPEQAENLWQSYSDSMCAGWIGLPKDDDKVFMCLDIKQCPKCKTYLFESPGEE